MDAYHKRIHKMAQKEHNNLVNYYKTKFKKTSRKVLVNKRKAVAYIGPRGKLYVKSLGHLVPYEGLRT
jgi:hypothetical protein